MFRRALLAAAVGIAASAVPLAAQTFTFNDVPEGTTTPFSRTVGGVTASFSATGDPGAFEVLPATFFSAVTASGNVLFRPGGTGSSDLLVVFDRPLTSASLLFLSNGAVPVTLQAFLGAQSVGSIAATGTIPVGALFPEGSLAFTTAGSFDRIRITAVVEIAIDDLTVRQATTNVVPEPSTIALVGGGLAVLAAGARRRRRPA